MLEALLIGGGVAILALMLGTAFRVGLHWRRLQDDIQQVSSVTRQHVELFHGDQLNEAAVENAKARMRDLLAKGDLSAVEARLRPGTQFAIQVRALAEIGTEEAGRILERQLERRLTTNPLEQSWYWFDLAVGLRNLHRDQSLPQLLRCSDAGKDNPLAHFLAAETVCFLSFAGYLRLPESSLGEMAMRVLHQALEGLRSGVQPHVVINGRVGELVECLWDHRPSTVHPTVVRVLVEAVRLLRRAPHAELVFADDLGEQEAFSWQVSHLAALEQPMTDYLARAPEQLCESFPNASAERQREILLGLIDLRAEAGGVVLPMLFGDQDSSGAAVELQQAPVTATDMTVVELAVLALTRSKNPRVPHLLMSWVARKISIAKRAGRRRRAQSPTRSSLPPDLPYTAILKALRGHPCREVEAFLIVAAQDWDPAIRAAAIGSLGWWEPLNRADVIGCLQSARRDLNAEVRQAGRAALARLGECVALNWFGQCLNAPEPHRVHDAIQSIAGEGIFMLWPELDRLADSENVDIAFHACEALERLREELETK